ncbi:MAG: hypothetical protein PF486_09560 [Prolixibacteraceae bacterium]|jgi:hypothetical protein|nr:hypothetical protein [Prolixibacteraceae bacterium]
MKILHSTTLLLLVILLVPQLKAQNKYNNFEVSVYTRAYEVQKMEDPEWLASTWKTISSQLDVDKIYLETHRDKQIVDEATMKKAIAFFEERGIEVQGGITYTINESNDFETYCYTKPDHRKKVQEIMEYTASFFDEVILDDFFFTSCKCEKCVEAKGDKSWSEYRLELMTEASKNLIIGPAKEVNPDVKVIIKYPNWYEHFHELGFNLETEPAIFDGLYTGTETRDAVFSNQHLQPYLSYLVFRYYNNLKPGGNGGGWVDTGGMRFYDRYAEQLWLTIFSKAPEMTLFDYRQMLYPLRDEWQPEWKNQSTSFDYESFLPVNEGETMAKTASQALEIIDEIAGELGKPYGIKTYKPFHSNGEYFLQNYLGMIGLPMDIVPVFPENDDMILLTEQAKKDPKIVEKIEQRLLNGKDVMITSGLLRALQDRGIRKIVNLEYTDRKSMITDFLLGREFVESDTPMLIPQIQYFTNDSWEMISGMDGGLGWPLLHRGTFANATLYLLVIPENFADLYNLPEPVLNKIRETLCREALGITLNGPANVSMFLYDNNTVVLHSFNNNVVDVEMMLKEKPNKLVDVDTGKSLKENIKPAEMHWGKVRIAGQYGYQTTLAPHSFKVFRIEK